MKSLPYVLAAIFGGVLLILLLFYRAPLLLGMRQIRAAIIALFSQHSLVELRLENDELRQELERLKQELCTGDAHSPFPYLRARVYSQYPFNDRSSVIIDRGALDGVKVGLPVLAKEGILFGKVRSVKRTQSEVQTVFDPSWKSSVNILPSKTKAALSGGFPPKLDLIPKDANVNEEDRVVNVAPDFPFGVSLGTIAAIEKGETDAWATARLELPYRVEEIGEVLVGIDFP